jgi:hypothetical protein
VEVILDTRVLKSKFGPKRKYVTTGSKKTSEVTPKFVWVIKLTQIRPSWHMAHMEWMLNLTNYLTN